MLGFHFCNWAENGTSTMRSNGAPGVGLGVLRQAQSNTLDISRGVHAVVAELQKSLPKGMAIRVTSDDATFIRGAYDQWGEVVRATGMRLE